jgi:hypothetical protein
VLALVIIDTVLVVLLAGLVAGLIRSHTDIIHALESLNSRIKPPPATHRGEVPSEDVAVSSSVSALEDGSDR